MIHWTTLAAGLARLLVAADELLNPPKPEGLPASIQVHEGPR